MDAQRWPVNVGLGTVTAVLEVAQSATAPVFVFAHGAGGHMADRGMINLASLLRTRGLAVLRFNFPYSERGSRRPDPMPVLKDCIVSVVASAVPQVRSTRWILGGRSMGGRAASMLAADGFACDALLLLAYPLHPAGQPEKLRHAHLGRIGCPVLCINGTRDALCRRDLMNAVVARLSSNWRMHWIEEADHSFHVQKASGRTDAEVLEEIGLATQEWLQSSR